MPSQQRGRPEGLPPTNGGGVAVAVAVGESRPGDLTVESLGGDPAETAVSAPSGTPPATATATDGAAAGAVTATWRSGQVTALWSINEVRNAWVHVAGVGWKKIYNGRDGAFMALTALASQARQTGRSINFREEADGMIYEIYLW
jgi:hypothetical protein